jgi:hypothetical protein
MTNAANFTQFKTEGGMDNFTYEVAQEFYNEGKFDGLASYIQDADTWPRDVVYGEYRKAHGKESAEKLFKIQFFN